MVIYKNGDLLKSQCEVICHQVNLDGIMGEGLALQIAKKYPEAEQKYINFLKYHNYGEALLGNYCTGVVKTKWSKRMVVNCFTQRYNFTTCYDAVRKCFKSVVELMDSVGLKTVGIPYGYGCGIAKGEWRKIDEIIHEVFDNSEVVCEVWKL